jgi:hypothetical protein
MKTTKKNIQKQLPWSLGYTYMTIHLKWCQYTNRDCRIGAMAYAAGYNRAKRDMKKKNKP